MNTIHFQSKLSHFALKEGIFLSLMNNIHKACYISLWYSW
jgi:hypothetical protein